ncbi:hypothetical protein ACPCIX_22940 [Streptomyces pseudogriseolus]|uniref:Uncharacterized protein n=2 Tax=Streptomyces TaxID=1883 RepID=A0AB39NN74_9ACTN|nr:MULTISPECIES: hypothetical protein [Streptomyces]MCI4142442.1 hypothetical protein [Streptomyces sp. MMS20-AI2-20]GGQ03011.1 hypothetical protein GCM10010233_19350 [Streptomyces gancidicus]GGS41161.1 hypothetical protein GCM10010285_20690 [Streptomyces rubiginosus]
MLQRTRPTERYARGFIAALAAVAALVLAANAGPAKAAGPDADRGTTAPVEVEAAER